jgi:hypothetical protein
MKRREFMQAALSFPFLGGCIHPGSARNQQFHLSPFQADVTPPIGHPLMGGGIEPAREISTPLTARGFVISGPGKPAVFLSIDWCEIRNSSYSALRNALASAAQTTPAKVLITSVHVHDAPVMDRDAEQILKAAGAPASVCDPDFGSTAIAMIVNALTLSLRHPLQVTHIGFGKAAVHKIASNRRFTDQTGRLSFSRTSSTKDPQAHAAPEGNIDPFLRTISFWNRDTPVLALHSYATHPMSTYGKGSVSWDFVGDARLQMERETPRVLQIYASGCSGNVTAGKYNDGAPARRAELAGRLAAAMKESWLNTDRTPLKEIDVRSVPFSLPLREDDRFSAKALAERLKSPRLFDQCLAALGLSWRQRVLQNIPLELVALKLGSASLVLFPAESYVEFQLYAQTLLPGANILCCGYGECGPGYIPIEKAWEEHDSNLREWCWVAPGSEEILKSALRKLLLGSIA